MWALLQTYGIWILFGLFFLFMLPMHARSGYGVGRTHQGHTRLNALGKLSDRRSRMHTLNVSARCARISRKRRIPAASPATHHHPGTGHESTGTACQTQQGLLHAQVAPRAEASLSQKAGGRSAR